VSSLGELGQVVVYRVMQRAGSAFTQYSLPFGDVYGYEVLVLRRLWRRKGRPLTTLQYQRADGTFGGRRHVVDLETGRSIKPEHEDKHAAWFVQVAFWRHDGLIRVGRQGADPVTSKLLDLAELRRMAGVA
jgi:hypothetical protein